MTHPHRAKGLPRRLAWLGRGVGSGKRLVALLKDCRATALIEFAFVLPVFCGMTFGLYEITQGVICYMKVSDAANSIADLIGQTTIAAGGIGNSDFDDMYIAGQLIMAPSTGSNLGLAIASVYYDSSGANPKLAWQVERGGAAAMSNTTSFVSGLGAANGSTLIVQATYTYTSLLDYFLTSPIHITAQVAAKPRNLIPPAYITGIPCPPASGLESCS
jgi:Flp pilus assembly protein TadG